MGKTTWIVQRVVQNPSPSLLALKRAVSVQGYRLVEVDVVPFTEIMPDIPGDIEPPIVIYGMTTLIENTSRHPIWGQGLFFDRARFEPLGYTKQLGDQMLNSDAKVMTCEELAASGLNADDEFFLRPNDDRKAFTGRVMSFRDYWRWYRGLDGLDNTTLKASTQILCSVQKTIVSEYRLFLLDGKVMASSQYLPDSSPFTPPEVIAFAEGIATQYEPAAAFVCDVALTANGFKVVEFNCINGSGFYRADVETIVRSLSSWQEAQV